MPSKKITRREFLRNGSKIAGAGIIASAASDLAAKSLFADKPGGRVRIGQIGTAHPHADGKIETIRKLKNHFELVGVVEPDPARRKDAVKEDEFKGVRWMSEQELLSTRDLDAVAVETEVSRLVPTARRCVQAGLHIHLDKPPGRSLKAFKELLNQAQSKRLHIQLGYMFRYNPAFKFCFEAVRKGWLGEIFEVHGVISKTIGDDRRKRLAKEGTGSMYLLGCHLIDALVAVLGEPSKVTPYSRQTRSPADKLVDNQLAVFEYAKATATIRSALVEVDGFNRRQFVVCGDKGTVDIRPLEPPKLKLALEEPRPNYKEGYQQVKLPAMTGRYDKQLAEFARIVRGEKEPDFSHAHDIAVHESLLRACEMKVY